MIIKIGRIPPEQILKILQSNDLTVVEQGSTSIKFKGRGIFYMIFLSMMNPFYSISSGEVDLNKMEIKLNINNFLIMSLIPLILFNLMWILSETSFPLTIKFFIPIFSILFFFYSYYVIKIRVENGFK